MAVLASLTLLAILVCSAWTADARTVRSLTASEMQEAVGLQSSNYLCMSSTNTCSDQTTGPNCPDCIQCTESIAAGHFCNFFSGYTCTSKPSIDCGEETQGVCIPDD
jgi:hypothetical protein